MPTVVTDVLGAAINGATGGDEGNGYGGGACFEAFSAQLTTYQEDSEHLYRVLRCMKVFTDEDGESNGGKKSVAAAAATAKLRVSDDDGDEAFCENLFGFAVVAPAATVGGGGTENGGSSSSSGSESESEGSSLPVEPSKNATGKNATALLAEESAKVQTLIALIAAGLREEAPFTFGTTRREREREIMDRVACYLTVCASQRLMLVLLYWGCSLSLFSILSHNRPPFSYIPLAVLPSINSFIDSTQDVIGAVDSAWKNGKMVFSDLWDGALNTAEGRAAYTLNYKGLHVDTKKARVAFNDLFITLQDIDMNATRNGMIAVAHRDAMTTAKTASKTVSSPTNLTEALALIDRNIQTSTGYRDDISDFLKVCVHCCVSVW